MEINGIKTGLSYKNGTKSVPFEICHGTTGHDDRKRDHPVLINGTHGHPVLNTKKTV